MEIINGIANTDHYLWVAARRRRTLLLPSGALLGKVLIAEAAANMKFGGPRKRRLFVATAISPYSVFLGVIGVLTSYPPIRRS